MAQHGYLREYDEDFREGRERSWGDHDRDWRERDRDRGFMLGASEYRPRADERFAGGRGRSRYGPEHGYGGFQGDYGGGREQGGFGGAGDWREDRRSFSSNPDDHYRSWRDKQMQALDRDYEDYCREREQQFHRDFDSWRSRRHGNPQPLQPGMTQTGLSADPTGTLELETQAGSPAEGGQDPMASATGGVESSGRGRR